MRDGSLLYGDIFRPDLKEKVPVILNIGVYQKDKLWVPPADLEEDANEHMNWETVNPLWWCPRGYAALRIDSRGSGRSPGKSEIFPYWLFPGEAKIERCVPNLPLSREVQRLQALRRALTVYRMAFGHARQEDVLEHLLARVPQERREELCMILQIDLSPPI